MTNPLSLSPNAIPGPERWQIAVMRSTGREAEALLLWEALNRGRRLFGRPDFDYPEPATTGSPELVTLPSGGPTDE